MDELFELEKYFPYKIFDPKQRSYIDYHLDQIKKCVENSLFSSAYTHLHIIYMSFIYFQLLRISKEKEKRFKFCWIGFPYEEKDFLIKPDSPFSFYRIKEKSVFRFFRIIGFNDSFIGDISSVVNNRNEALHANGIISCSTESEFTIELTKYLRIMKRVINEEFIFIKKIYNRIIVIFDKDYFVTLDDIEINFGTFSLSEMELLTVNKNDVISKYIKENII